MRFWLFVTLLVLSAQTFAAEPATKPASQPSADAESPTLLKPDDKDALIANLDKDVVIEGVIETAAWSSSGKVMNAKFKDSGESKLQVIVFVKNREKFDNAFSGDVTKALSGAKVRIKGKLKDYKGSPEIVLDQVNQITVVEAAPG